MVGIECEGLSAARRFDGLPSISLIPSQKTTNFDRNLSFFIQAAGLVWNHALACMVSPQAHGITKGAFFCGLIPYDCFAINSIPQQVADSMHDSAVIEYA